jgi:hypothetical protein
MRTVIVIVLLFLAGCNRHGEVRVRVMANDLGDTLYMVERYVSRWEYTNWESEGKFWRRGQADSVATTVRYNLEYVKHAEFREVKP